MRFKFPAFICFENLVVLFIMDFIFSDLRVFHCLLHSVISEYTLADKLLLLCRG